MTPIKFPPIELDSELAWTLRRFNPWWEDKPFPRLPSLRRHLVTTIHRKLELNLAPIVVVRGPRQVGKSTAQLQVLRDFLGRGIDPRRVFRIQCDASPLVESSLLQPILRCIDWYEQEILGKSLNQAARDDQPAFLFLDEVQVLGNWASQLKSLVDSSTLQVLVTGSSAMRIEAGRDSLAGRITTLEAGVLSLSEIAMFHGFDLGKPFFKSNGSTPLQELSFWQALRDHGEELQSERDRAFALFAERGGYPVVHERGDVEWGDVADLLNETVIQRMLRHDFGSGDPDRKMDATLFEEVFRLACRYAGQAPTARFLAREAQGSLGVEVSPSMVLEHLELLADTLLVRLIKALELRLKREQRRDKICLADHALRASWLKEIVPLDPEVLAGAPHLAPLAGHLAESAVGATLKTIRGLDVAHRPARERVPELDYVLTLGRQRIPLEVKYQRRLDPRRDTVALKAFLDQEANEATFGLIITQSDVEQPEDPRLVALPLPSLMLLI